MLIPSHVLDAGAALSFVVAAVAILKPIIERIPFVGVEGDVHDSVLRILNFALALGTLVVLARLEGGQWPYASQLLSIFVTAAGASVGAHTVYHLARQSTPSARATKTAKSGIAKSGVAHGAPAPAAASDMSAPVSAG
jgi:hypothetical protein